MESFVVLAGGIPAQWRTHTEQGLFQRKQLKEAFLSLLFSFSLFSLLTYCPNLFPIRENSNIHT